MPWITVPKLNGKVYVPEKSLDDLTKHYCPDCFNCQHCSDDRCNACRLGCKVEKGTDN
jgi:hypothetical protein